MSQPRIPREIRDILADERNQGWRFDGFTGGTHIRLRHVSGKMIVACNTPSDVRARKNMLAQMRRVEKEEASR